MTNDRRTIVVLALNGAGAVLLAGAGAVLLAGAERPAAASALACGEG